MNKNTLLEELNGAKIGIVGNESKLFPTNIARVLSEKGAEIVLFTVGHGPDGQFVTIPQQDVVIAPFDMELPDTMTGQVLRWRLGNEQANSESVDIDDVSANHFAKKVAELIDESKFKLPEWFQGYSFRWVGTVINHPVTKERCRAIELYNNVPIVPNVHEEVATIYLDADGQLFNAEMVIQIGVRLPSNIQRTGINEDSIVEVFNRYRGGRPCGNNNPDQQKLSYFKKIED